MRVIGAIASIWRYPVKSLHGESLARAEVAETGIAGDRERALFVRDGHARAGKTYRGKEHDGLHLIADPQTALRLGAQAGVGLELREGGGFFDGAPISVLVDRWLVELSAHVGYQVEPERFRPNFFVRADPSLEGDEAALAGARLTLGDVVLAVRSPIGRCVVTTYDLAGGAADPRVLRFVALERGSLMGIYCNVARPGRVHVGDVLSATPCD
jgi:uncharacterized protein